MKKLLLLCAILMSFSTVNAQFSVETLRYSGAHDKRINIVILSEGYQSFELNKFMLDAEHFTNTLFNHAPFNAYTSYFNVYAIKVPSNESGADHPATALDVDETGQTPVFVDTYFNATYDSFGSHRKLYYEIDGNNANNTQQKITEVLANHFPEYDQAIIIVNSAEYGGSGGEFPMAYNGYWGAAVTIHELGHSLFNLKDEYYPGDIFVAEAINMTQETNTNLVKWKNWLNINNVGIYVHGNSGTAASWYKPHQNCIMERIDKGFCPVCQEGIVEKIHDLVPPIDSYIPNNSSIEPSEFPLNFELNLIQPNPNSLISTWFLNGVEFNQNIESISINESDLNSGTNTLNVTITDDSTFLKVDNHNAGSHVYIVTWTITYNALGLKDIKSNTDTYYISLHPNPAHSILYLKFESNTSKSLKADIISMDGKHVKSTILSNHTETPLDVSQLAPGIYTINYYADTILVVSKKWIKY
ncbi:T9SS type A sorting domain-containing protein [Tamlana fucoidanivorans]|uniref:T9SS type A sorting domain-containing protein n=1 Tax=Allotamlana fucoidanivorans TaxID=2583814 RepID=A0A5C4SK42_9FLAO|nr:M64 family metallopeptidase [Tamlana fucoidanivorans]TNJ43783.1 T9SS type A sorting domain-containing protein [Tamlana fucoidanivorans]